MKRLDQHRLPIRTESQNTLTFLFCCPAFTKFSDDTVQSSRVILDSEISFYIRGLARSSHFGMRLHIVRGLSENWPSLAISCPH